MSIQERLKMIFNSFPYRPIIGILVMLGCFAFWFTLLYKEIPAPNRDAVNIGSGVMFGLATAIVSYYFGSSKDKTDSDKMEQASKVNNES